MHTNTFNAHFKRQCLASQITYSQPSLLTPYFAGDPLMHYLTMKLNNLRLREARHLQDPATDAGYLPIHAPA